MIGIISRRMWLHCCWFSTAGSVLVFLLCEEWGLAMISGTLLLAVAIAEYRLRVRAMRVKRLNKILMGSTQRRD
jgi:hypothetical protein